MNILVYPHELAMGGSQINAIELAAAMCRRGHNVTIAAPDGVLSSMIRRLGLDYVPISRAPYIPSAATVRFSLQSMADRLVYQQTVSQKQPLVKRRRSMARTFFELAKFQAKMEWLALGCAGTDKSA